MEGKEELRVLLHPRNQIVKVERHFITNQNALVLNKGNLDSWITSVFQKYPSSLNLPIAFFSVLGNNRDRLRALHTDWLIHYHENYGNVRRDTEEIYKSWQPKFGPPDQLKYIGQYTRAEPGVYIWPTPFAITEETSAEAQEQHLIGFILYAHALGGLHRDPQCNALLDYLVASVTQKIVIFNGQEKGKLEDFVRARNGNVLPPLTSFVESTGSLVLASTRSHGTLSRGWDAFMKSLKNKESILNGVERARNLPTLGNVVDYMERMINSMYLPSDAVDTSPLSPMGSDISAGIEDKMHPLYRPPSAPSAPSSTHSSEFSPRSSPHSTLFSPPPSPRPIIYSPVEIDNRYNIEGFREQFQRWLADDIKLPGDLRKIVQDLRLDQWKSMMERLTVLQKIIHGYNLELLNMFDNYVCFIGVVDEKQVIKFQETARQREKSNWMAAKIETNSHDDPIIEMIRTGITQWLSKRYVEENFDIIDIENSLGKQVCQRLARAYVSKMKNLMRGKLRLPEAQVIHRKILNHCCNMMSSCMDFGGRLNYTVMVNMTLLEQVLNAQFDDWRKKKRFYAEDEIHNEIRSKPDVGGLVSSYLREIDGKMPLCATAKQLENLHEVTFKKLASGLPSAERDDLEATLLSYLVYTTESGLERSQDYPHGNEAPTMCIHLTADWMKVMMRQAYGWRVVKFQQQQPSGKKLTTLCPARVSWIKGRLHLGFDGMMTIRRSKGSVDGGKEWHGSIFDCINMASKSNFEMATSILKALFVHLWRLEGLEAAGGQVVVIVPSWFSVADRALLRKSAGAAGLARTFLVNETSLAAYQLFMENDARKLICVVIMRMDVVRIEIFGGTNGEGMSLMALAEGEWDNDGNFLQILEAAFERAVGQLPTNKGYGEMVCFLQTDHADWRPELVRFFARKRLILREEEKGEDFVDAAASRLCSDPGKIRGLLLDYATPKKNPVNVQYSSSNSTLTPKQQEILRKCQVMEMQLNNKEVRLSILTRKVALETIERARLNVRTNQNTEKEEWELEELIDIHKFKVLLD